MSVDFKPSDVAVFATFPPLCDTFKKTEREVAAAYIVIALAASGDEWTSLVWDQIAIVLREALERDKAATDETPEARKLRLNSPDGLIHALITNPFARPDFHGLAEDGNARWLGEPGKSALELTEVGIERLKKWVRRPSRAGEDSPKTE